MMCKTEESSAFKGSVPFSYLSVLLNDYMASNIYHEWIHVNGARGESCVDGFSSSMYNLKTSTRVIQASLIAEVAEREFSARETESSQGVDHIQTEGKHGPRVLLVGASAHLGPETWDRRGICSSMTSHFLRTHEPLPLSEVPHIV